MAMRILGCFVDMMNSGDAFHRLSRVNSECTTASDLLTYTVDAVFGIPRYNNGCQSESCAKGLGLDHYQPSTMVSK